MTLPSRIQYLVNIKAAGNKSRFARMVGWPAQYMSRITKDSGATVGLAVVTKILETFPDIDGRWLVLGEGEPFVADFHLKRLIYERISEYTKLADQINKLTPEEIEKYKKELEAGRAHDDQATENNTYDEPGEHKGQLETPPKTG